MNAPELVTMAAGVDMQGLATALIVAVTSSAAWGYFKDRRKSKAEGTVAAATVEIQVEGARVQNLEQRFGFAQTAWNEERASFERRIRVLEDELNQERSERSAEKAEHEEKVGLLEMRVQGMRRELQELIDELAVLRGSGSK